jgi:hypothetical protein
MLLRMSTVNPLPIAPANLLAVSASGTIGEMKANIDNVSAAKTAAVTPSAARSPKKDDRSYFRQRNN